MKQEIEVAIKRLSKADTASLYADLGAYTSAFAMDPKPFSDPTAVIAKDATHAGVLTEAIDVGKKVFKRWQKAIYELVCGSGATDVEARQSILSALKLNSPDALATAITLALVTYFSVGPAIAVIVGVLFAKVLFPPIGEEVCTFWKGKIA